MTERSFETVCRCGIVGGGRLTKSAIRGELLTTAITNEALASVPALMFAVRLPRRQHLAANGATEILRSCAGKRIDRNHGQLLGGHGYTKNYNLIYVFFSYNCKHALFSI